MKNYLFITGCPRSGTSALSLLIGSHPKIAMGVERFHNLVIPKFKLEKSHFIKDRFFDFQSGDSHINLKDQPRIALSYESLKTRYSNCDYVGDKIPYLYDYYDDLTLEFNTEGSLNLIVIIRNIFDVANSYQVRAENKKLGWSRDFKKAVGDWNRCMRKTLNSYKQFNKVILIQYEDLYGSENPEMLNKLFDLLGLKTEDELTAFYKNQMSQSRKKEKERKQNYLLNMDQKRFISMNAKTNLYRKLVATIPSE